MTENQTADGRSGRYIVAAMLGVCATIFGAAAAIMDPSSTRILMTVAAVVFVALAGALLGAAVAKDKRQG